MTFSHFSCRSFSAPQTLTRTEKRKEKNERRESAAPLLLLHRGRHLCCERAGHMTPALICQLTAGKPRPFKTLLSEFINNNHSMTHTNR